MTLVGYDFDGTRFAELLLARFYPEKTDHESALLRDYLQVHLPEFDRVSFSVRVGNPAPIDDTLPAATQRQMALVTRRRIDLVGWSGRQATLVEAKSRVGHAVLGQLLSDRQLWIEERPEDPAPALVAIGRESDADAVRILNDHGISVFLYAGALAG